MTLRMLLAMGSKFMLKLVAFYFATLVVLALVFPEMGKYQIIVFSWLVGATVALCDRRSVTQRN